MSLSTYLLTLAVLAFVTWLYLLRRDRTAEDWRDNAPAGSIEVTIVRNDADRVAYRYESFNLTQEDLDHLQSLDLQTLEDAIAGYACVVAYMTQDDERFPLKEDDTILVHSADIPGTWSFVPEYQHGHLTGVQRDTIDEDEDFIGGEDSIELDQKQQR